MGIEKVGEFWVSKAKILASFIRGRLFLYEVAGTGDIVGRLRNRTSRLMF